MKLMQICDHVSGRMPELEPDFIPAVVWNKNYHKLTAESGKSKELKIAFQRKNGNISTVTTLAFQNPNAEEFALELRHVERLIKGMLWMRGGYKIMIPDRQLADALFGIYSASGTRAFDFRTMSQIYETPFQIIYAETIPEEKESAKVSGGHLDGCRIGFDLGGTNRKVAALIDGKVVFTGKLPWDPYFQKDSEWHKEKINESIRQAAEHLPQIDAIGGSTAGVIIDGRIRISSLFRGIPEDQFESRVCGIFKEIAAEWKVPFEIANDGEVTALSGAAANHSKGVLGISMGTSTAGGYVTPEGCITDWLNEMAFVPVDYNHNAAADEWSGDVGCGVQYFSQQAAVRFARNAGFTFEQNESFPSCFAKLSKALAENDPRAVKVFESIGICFGYTLAEWSKYYELKHVLLLGGVASGTAGKIITQHADLLLKEEFPELSIVLELPDSEICSGGQAVAAATLAEIR